MCTHQEKPPTHEVLNGNNKLNGNHELQQMYHPGGGNRYVGGNTYVCMCGGYYLKDLCALVLILL